MDRITASRKRTRGRWQARLLPLMSLVLIVGALFFAVMSVVELRDFYARVEHRPLDLQASFATYEARIPAQERLSPDYLEFRIRALLEADALQRRYHQANATMLARVWTRQLGFLTGMILSVVGAAFILGRLQGDPTRIDAEGRNFKAALATSSPGIVLCSLGTLLMAITLAIPFGVETSDRALFLQPSIRIPPPQAGSLGGTDLQDSPVRPDAPPDPGPPPPARSAP